MPEITIYVWKYLYEFSSMNEWVSKASKRHRVSGLTEGEALYVDAKGRICTIGRHFRIAKEENAFPVRVYQIREE